MYPRHPLADAMILAAGRGERMRPLTDHSPKPLLHVRGRALLEWHLLALARAGIGHTLINTGWLGARIPALLGSQYPLAASKPQAEQCMQLHYSREDIDFGHGIETAGGISRALPRLSDTFWLLAGDVYTPEFEFDERLRQDFAQSAALAHLWLVPNPAHNRAGDFTLEAGLARPSPSKSNAALASSSCSSAPSYTYSTIALIKRGLFEAPWCALPAGNPGGIAAPLGPLLFKAAAAGQVSATVYTGPWTDVGTPERLALLNGV